MRTAIMIFLAGMLICTGLPAFAEIPWPVYPDSTVHRIGNSYGEFQYYGGSPYLHPGIDIMAPAGTPVYAVKAGYVKAILTTGAELHWRVAIGDSSGSDECNAWLYAHLSEFSIYNMAGLSVGDYVEEGQYIGDLVTWTVAEFHHLHFVQIRHSGGATSWSQYWNWLFVTNPMDELGSVFDPDPPVIENAISSQLFAFCRNEIYSYFAEGAVLDGDVDIICRTYDYQNHPAWRLAPHRIEYKIDGDSSLPWTTSVCFSGLLYYEANTDVVYQQDATCYTQGDYNVRDFFFNVTNTDGDSIIEPLDRAHSWETANFHNGEYTVTVRVYDPSENMTEESMTVMVGNYFELTGYIHVEGSGTELPDARVTVVDGGLFATTDSAGNYTLAGVGGGSQVIRVSRPGYQSRDTVLMMNQNQSLDMGLEELLYVCGDANGDTVINLLDILYLISFLYGDPAGPQPEPFEAGDANADWAVNLLDVLYLIDFLYGSPPGPEPLCP